jgi:hypothetical protein
MEKKDDRKMRAVKKEKVEHIVEADGGILHLDGIIIAGKEYLLDIHNYVPKKGEEVLDLNFNNGDYIIRIEKEGIKFNRIVYRHNHDHNDSQSLLVGITDEVRGVKKGEIKWHSRFPYQGEGRDFFRVDFGSIELDY